MSTVVAWFSIVLDVMGIISFSVWLVQIRRRPELEVEWNYNTEGYDKPFLKWCRPPIRPDDNVAIVGGSPLYVRIVATNVGDANADSASVNVVVPSILRIDCPPDHDPAIVQRDAEDAFVGQPPDNKAHYYSWSRPWPIGFSWVHLFEITYDNQSVPHPKESLQLKIKFTIDHNGLNRKGTRWFSGKLTPETLTSVSPLAQSGRGWRHRPPKAQTHVIKRLGSRTDWRNVHIMPRNRWCVIGYAESRLLSLAHKLWSGR